MQLTTVYGPPGTGKTRALAEWTCKHLDANPDSKTAIVSFTRSAANQIYDYIGDDARLASCSTIHAMAYRLLGLSRDSVFTDQWRNQFSTELRVDDSIVEEILSGYERWQSSKTTEPPGAFISRIGIRQRQTVTDHVVKNYEIFKQNYGLLDFHAILVEGAKIEPGVDTIVLDEAQDCSPAQWECLESWTRALDHCVIAGDDDQSLYQWNGAQPADMGRFSARHASKIEVLRQSHRVPKKIQRLAESVIQRVPRVNKEYEPRDAEGSVDRLGDVRTLTDLDPAVDTMILYRNHSLRASVEERLQELALPYYAGSGGPAPLQTRIGQCAANWSRWVAAAAEKGDEYTFTDRDAVLLRAGLRKNLLTSLVGSPAEFFEAYPVWHTALNTTVEQYRYLRRVERKYGLSLDGTKIRIMTIHGSKGLQADRVVLLNARGNRTYEEGSEEDEVRVFYVGITRARERLTIVQGPRPHKWI